MITFAVVGAGYRTETYLRICRELSDDFRCSAVVARTPEKGDRLTAKYGVPTQPDLTGLEADFVVTSVGWGANPGIVMELVAQGHRVLSETPPAPDDAGLDALLAVCPPEVQVAEQYPFAPMALARLALIAGGKLGEVRQAEVGSAHGYHGVALLRAYLGDGDGPVRLRALRHEAPVAATFGREGLSSDAAVERRTIAWIEFESGALGVFDFTGETYFSPIRPPRTALRGSRGILEGARAEWLGEGFRPRRAELRRVEAGGDGDLYGQGLRHAELAGETLYAPAWPAARLSDDELAVAELLRRVAEFHEGGPAPYPVARAARDHRIAMAMDRAAASGEAIRV